jgi:2-C-methyl-D-erythritol 4-phosphate cytidylyltransferase
VVPAAGSGSRFGGAKLWAELGGQPVLAWVLRALGDPASGLSELVVVADPRDHRRIAELSSELAPRLGCRCVPGGARRQESVSNGIGVTAREWVLVHDGARPAVTPELLARVLGAAQRVGAASAYVPVVDSTARVVAGRLDAILPRGELGAIQTPQAFRRDLLLRAHQAAAAAGLEADDDAALVLALGEPVAAVPGDPSNLKVTRTQDLLALRTWLGAPEGHRP